MPYTPSEFVTLLHRVLPHLEPQPHGASPSAIQALRGVWDVDLPPFYEWFLTHFGVNAGPLATTRFDFSIDELLSAGGPDDGESQAFTIAVGRDSVLPQDIAYDLRYPTANDARVLLARVPLFDSLEAMLAWRIYERYVLPRFPQRCCGVIRHRTEDFDAELVQATGDLGFASALEIGPRAKVLDGAGCAMTILGNYRDQPTVAFNLGTASSVHSRTLLGRLGVEYGFELEALSWTPSLEKSSG